MVAAKRRTPSFPEKTLTEVELELMTYLWRLGEATVGDVLDALPLERDLAYTSVSTVLRILERKGLVASRKQGRGHVYTPLLAKEDYEASSVRRLVTQVFDGTPEALVRRLLETQGVSQGDLDEIDALLKLKMGKKS